MGFGFKWLKKQLIGDVLAKVVPSLNDEVKQLAEKYLHWQLRLLAEHELMDLCVMKVEAVRNELRAYAAGMRVRFVTLSGYATRAFVGNNIVIELHHGISQFLDLSEEDEGEKNEEK